MDFEHTKHQIILDELGRFMDKSIEPFDAEKLIPTKIFFLEGERINYELLYFISAFYGADYIKGRAQIMTHEEIENNKALQSDQRMYFLSQPYLSVFFQTDNISKVLNNKNNDYLQGIIWNIESDHIEASELKEIKPIFLKQFRIFVNITISGKIVKINYDLISNWEEIVINKMFQSLETVVHIYLPCPFYLFSTYYYDYYYQNSKK